jgi:hypothetical protein
LPIEDYAIDMGWIVTSDQSGRDRLREVTQTALAEFQRAVVETTSTSWPSGGGDVDLPEPHAEIAGDTVNPILRLFYGPSHAPVIELEPQILLSTSDRLRDVAYAGWLGRYRLMTVHRSRSKHDGLG